MPADLLSLEAAQQLLLADLAQLAPERVRISDGAGRVLAADICARLTQPPADLSAMDGYALRFADLPGPLKIVGESAAGRPWRGHVEPGQAIRIFTGAHVPNGADTIALQEDARLEGDSLSFPHEGPEAKGAHVRPQGMDFRTGAVLARQGMKLRPAHVGLLAAAGHATIEVARRPHVAVLATGDELVLPGQIPATAQIVNSNTPMLTAMLRQAGAQVTDLGIVPDQEGEIAAAIARAAGHDLLLTIGGASVGDHDLVKQVLQSQGAVLDFWRIAIRPGKPLLAGRMGPMRVLGLPGNPVSAFVCGLLFARPLVAAMQGDRQPLPVERRARLAVPVPANGPRRAFLRAWLRSTPEGDVAEPLPVQDSALLSELAAANALVVRPERASALAAGATVPVLTLSASHG